MSRPLRAQIDGVALPDAEARALWERFSTWMEENRGDLGGFAAKEGFASVHPSVENGEPVLLVSRVTVQRPYVSAAHRTQVSGGSGGRQRTVTKRRAGRGHIKK